MDALYPVGTCACRCLWLHGRVAESSKTRGDLQSESFTFLSVLPNWCRTPPRVGAPEFAKLLARHGITLLYN